MSPLDIVRAMRPEFGFAVYAYKPGEPVTVEVHAPSGDIFTAHAETETAAFEQLFGPLPQPQQQPDDEEESVFD